MKCSKKILALMISLSIIFAIILSMTLLRKSSRSLEQKYDNKTAYIFETDHGEVSGTLDDWLSGEYADYVLDEGKSSCDGNNDSSGLSWDNERHTVLLTSNEADKCTLYFHLGSKSLGDSIKDLVVSGNEVTSGGGYLYYHDGNLANGANDNGYRYAGNQPNNYICFGAGSEGYNNGTSATCPTTNKYRIIGLVPVETKSNGKQTLVKIIKAEYITATELGISSTGTMSSSYSSLKRVEDAATSVPGFHWNDTSNNTWGTSALYQALNGTYLTNLGNWANKVETVKWNVGGWNTSQVTPKAAYTAEMTNSGGTTGSGTIVEAKVGLMYLHDYGFASIKDSWIKTLYDYDNTGNKNRENNWLFNGVYEWTISRGSSGSYYAFYVYYTGFVLNNLGVYSSSLGVRPVLYLTSDVKLGGGEGIDGSQSKPYKVS